MPNYVYNRLTIIGKMPAEIQKFYLKISQLRLRIKRMNRYHSTCLSPKVIVSLGDWRIKNWGCKWDASNTKCIPGETKLDYTFTTPWSPPSAWLDTVSRKYPALTFYLRFEDEAFAFFALAKVTNGVTTFLEDYNVGDIIPYLTRKP